MKTTVAALLLYIATAYGCCLVGYEDKNCENGAPIETRNWPPDVTKLDICLSGNNNSVTNETCQSNCTYVESCGEEASGESPTTFVAGWNRTGKTIKLKCCTNEAIKIWYCADFPLVHDSDLPALGDTAFDHTMLIKNVHFRQVDAPNDVDVNSAPSDAEMPTAPDQAEPNPEGSVPELASKKRLMRSKRQNAVSVSARLCSFQYNDSCAIDAMGWAGPGSGGEGTGADTGGGGGGVKIETPATDMPGGETTEAQPVETATAPPEETVETTAGPPEETTEVPSEQTTTLPPEETTAAPPEETTLVPTEATTKAPPEETTVAPLPVTTVAPAGPCDHCVFPGVPTEGGGCDASCCCAKLGDCAQTLAGNAMASYCCDRDNNNGGYNNNDSCNNNNK